jgi:serine/threonine protein kinase
VENKEYDKKADIWAAGCILYEMCTLQPPFYATNMLLLAKKIAEVQFDKSLVGGYSNLLQSVICSCLTVNPSARPDSHQIGSMLAEHLMKQLDDTLNDCSLLENKITTERNRALKQFEKKERNTSAKRMLFTGSPPASPHNQKLSPSRRSSLGSPLLLSISSQHLKEISDPVSDILQAVHKIVYITQATSLFS